MSWQQQMRDTKREDSTATASLIKVRVAIFKLDKNAIAKRALGSMLCHFDIRDKKYVLQKRAYGNFFFFVIWVISCLV